MAYPGRAFEQYSWPTIRRNFPLQAGWDLLGEQLTLSGGRRPDYILYNERSSELAVVECKDVSQLTTTHINQAVEYANEIVADHVEVLIAGDTSVSDAAKELADEEGVRIRRLRWRADPPEYQGIHPLVLAGGLIRLAAWLSASESRNGVDTGGR